MANVFISHRGYDTSAAERLAAVIRSEGHTVWLDTWQINIGDSIVARVQAGLEGARYLVLCCSAAGMSDWQNREWMSALARHLAGLQVKILPILLPGGELPAILSDIRYADLDTDWDAGLQTLLKAIRQ
jgi:hypothetical protein